MATTAKKTGGLKIDWSTVEEKGAALTGPANTTFTTDDIVEGVSNFSNGTPYVKLRNASGALDALLGFMKKLLGARINSPQWKDGIPETAKFFTDASGRLAKITA